MARADPAGRRRGPQRGLVGWHNTLPASSGVSGGRPVPPANAKIGVMAGENAANVLVQVKLAAAKKAGQKLDKEEIAKFHAMIKGRLEDASTATNASSLLWDDGIIEPEETRQTLAMALEVSGAAPAVESKFDIFRIWKNCRPE